MLRSYLLALKLKVAFITAWCRILKETPLYAILSGFPFGDTPGVGTFSDCPGCSGPVFRSGSCPPVCISSETEYRTCC